MAEGRWLDDARVGEPAGHAGPRLTRWMKWTWPVMVAAAIALTAVTSVGWVIAMVAWFATCAIPNHLDQKLPAARRCGHGATPTRNRW